MNARQAKKKLKAKIDILESDNRLMREIIADSPTMQELYNAYNKPKFVTHTTMQFHEFRVQRMIPFHMVGLDGVIERAKRAAAEDLLEEIKDNITYEVDNVYMASTITASIFVGREE